jgi:hypothetical protein
MRNRTQLKQQNHMLSTAMGVKSQGSKPQGERLPDDTFDASRGFALGIILGLTTWVGIIALVWYIAK